MDMADHERRIAKLEKIVAEANLELQVLRIAQGTAGDTSKAFFEALESRYPALREKR